MVRLKWNPDQSCKAMPAMRPRLSQPKQDQRQRGRGCLHIQNSSADGRGAGTPFQRKVWTALPNIPAGTTMSYGALAAKLNVPKAMRAVGHANGSNPISVVVPCHRLIGANGSLIKYGGGLERKRWLLQHEGGEV